MRPTQYSSDAIAGLIRKQKIASLPELMQALGTDARRTVFRKLSELAYRTSYSHCGRYYTLDEVADFDQRGLWSHRQVWFSRHGTLLDTATALVNCAEAGYFVEELDNLLQVGTKDALRMLVSASRVARDEVAGRFLYCAVQAHRRRQQIVTRQARLAQPGIAGALPPPALLPEELQGAIVLFYACLDEKQRRLYAGLESLKSGRGGDASIAELLGLDVGTVARGRRELLAREVDLARIRRTGAGRKPVEKKPRKSSSASKS
jgi:hypothetical protein